MLNPERIVLVPENCFSLKKKKKCFSPWRLIYLTPQFYRPDMICRHGHELHISERHYYVSLAPDSMSQDREQSPSSSLSPTFTEGEGNNKDHIGESTNAFPSIHVSTTWLFGAGHRKATRLGVIDSWTHQFSKY